MDSFVCKCVSDILDGLRDGLSHFSGASRAAVIFCIDPADPIYICDPQHLLSGHEPRFKELYLDNSDWHRDAGVGRERNHFGYMLPEKNLQLAGLISCGGRSSSVFYQMWFTEHHPDMCAVGPTERWLEHAAWRLSHDVANERELYTGISGSFLKEYATSAVRDYIVDRMNVLLGWDSHLRIFPTLDAVLGVLRTREERAPAQGDLVFVERRSLDSVQFLTRFPDDERPLLDNFKHVRKLLLAVENSERKLVSEGTGIVGISCGDLPEFYLMAEFNGSHGFLKLPGETVCSFSDGSFKSTTRRAKLVHMEEALLEADLDSAEGTELFKIITSLVHNAQQMGFGCTLVVDLNAEPVGLSGQRLALPLDLRQEVNLELAKSLSRVDGALHIGRDLYLHGFAGLLDGHAIPGEDRARGARFNSALRFTAEHPNLVVVVVSSDRPVSMIQEGVEISAQCPWKPLTSCLFQPKTLADWVGHES